MTAVDPRPAATTSYPAPLPTDPALEIDQSQECMDRKKRTLQQMAAEPLTMDPVAFNWGADGKLWVAEMGDYPLGLDGKSFV